MGAGRENGATVPAAQFFFAPNIISHPMRSKALHCYDTKKPAFGALVDRFVMRVQGALDHALTARFVERVLRAKHALDAEIYGRPNKEALDESAARVEALFTGSQVVGIGFSGKAQAEFARSPLLLNVAFLLARADGSKEIAVAMDWLPKNTAVGSSWPELANWLLKEKITIARNEGQWAWNSAKSVDPRVIAVMHKDKFLSDDGRGQEERSILKRATTTLEMEREKEAAARAAIEQRKAELALKKDPSLQERLRLESLLPESSIQRALMLQENKELEGVVKAVSGDTPAAPARKASRI